MLKYAKLILGFCKITFYNHLHLFQCLLDFVNNFCVWTLDLPRILFKVPPYINKLLIFMLQNCQPVTNLIGRFIVTIVIIFDDFHWLMCFLDS